MKMLTKDEQVELLRLARNTISSELGIGEKIKNQLSSDIFMEKCGAFVTIHSDGRLRGCIGYITGTKNMADTIEEMSLCAAFRDPRFPPLTKDEYASIDIELSILGPIEEVKNIEEIEVGLHGIIITRGFHSGLLLPQVAVEHKFDRYTFLQNTCFKAGLPHDAWKKEGTKIEKFTAQVFGEKGLGLL